MSSSYIALELASADENKTCVGTCVNTESIFFEGFYGFLVSFSSNLLREI